MPLSLEEIQKIASDSAAAVINNSAINSGEKGPEEEFDEEIDNILCHFADKVLEAFGLYQDKKYVEAPQILHSIENYTNCGICYEVIDEVTKAGEAVEAAEKISEEEHQKSLATLEDKVRWAVSAFCPDAEIVEDDEESQEVLPPQEAS